MADYQDRYYDEEFVFRKPTWRRVLPVVLIMLVWLLPLFLWKGPVINIPGPLTDNINAALTWFNRTGVTMQRALLAAGALSLVLLLWLFWGMEKLIITPDTITRRLPLGFRKTLRWTELDEVLIDHVEARFEGEATIRKILTLYEVRRRFLPWRRKMIITNGQFDDFEEAERLALEVSVPAIAQRRREEIVTTGKPALFPIRDPADSMTVFVLFSLAVITAALALFDALWVTAVLFLRPYLAGVSGLLFLAALKKAFFKQVGIDLNNIYIMRRSWIRRKIPIEQLADVRVRDNQMRIFAVGSRSEKPRQVFRTRRFVRNRGVLLSLIREGYEARQTLDATPIPPMRSILPEEPIE